MNFDHRLESVYTSGPKKSSCSSSTIIIDISTNEQQMLSGEADKHHKG